MIIQRFTFEKNPVLVNSPDPAWVSFRTLRHEPIDYIYEGNNNYFLNYGLTNSSIEYIIEGRFLTKADYNTILVNLQTIIRESDTPSDEYVKMLITNDDTALKYSIVDLGATAYPILKWIPVFANNIFMTTYTVLRENDGTTHKPERVNTDVFKFSNMKGKSVNVLPIQI